MHFVLHLSNKSAISAITSYLLTGLRYQTFVKRKNFKIGLASSLQVAALCRVHDRLRVGGLRRVPCLWVSSPVETGILQCLTYHTINK